MLGNLQVRFGGGQTKKEQQCHLVGWLPTLEKQGCLWSDHRSGDQLLSVHLDFPDGTVYTQAKYACEVRFPKGGMLWWSIKPDGGNGISVPYVYL